MPDTMRQIVLRKRPEGMVTPECFELVSAALPELGEGEALVAVDYLSLDPTIRGWISHDTYLPAVAIGEPVRSAGAGRVIESRNPGLPVGTNVLGLTGWQEYVVAGPDTMVQALPEGIDLTDALSIYGTTGVTAYFGLLDVGRPQAGDTVLVSGAAGATGSIVGQLAKIHDCRAVGIAGTPEKCRWLVDELGFDAAINYRHDDVAARVAETCPDGVDIYFDNVGGPLLEIVLDHLALRGRVVMCGSISQYNAVEPEPGPRNLFNLTVQRGRMEGFIVLDYLDRFADAALQLGIWVAEGRIHHRVHVVDGFERTPEALNMLFTGANEGKLLVRVTEA
jgi:NADPH-dependent curcumin reductase